MNDTPIYTPEIIYITRYAITRGIVKARRKNTYGDVEGCSFPLYKARSETRGIDWHTSLEAAQNRAEEMRQHKIRAYEKAIERLKKLKITRT